MSNHISHEGYCKYSQTVQVPVKYNEYLREMMWIAIYVLCKYTYYINKPKTQNFNELQTQKNTSRNKTLY